MYRPDNATIIRILLALKYFELRNAAHHETKNWTAHSECTKPFRKEPDFHPLARLKTKPFFRRMNASYLDLESQLLAPSPCQVKMETLIYTIIFEGDHQRWNPPTSRALFARTCFDYAAYSPNTTPPTACPRATSGGNGMGRGRADNVMRVNSSANCTAHLYRKVLSYTLPPPHLIHQLVL